MRHCVFCDGSGKVERGLGMFGSDTCAYCFEGLKTSDVSQVEMCCGTVADKGKLRAEFEELERSNKELFARFKKEKARHGRTKDNLDYLIVAVTALLKSANAQDPIESFNNIKIVQKALDKANR